MPSSLTAESGTTFDSGLRQLFDAGAVGLAVVALDTDRDRPAPWDNPGLVRVATHRYGDLPTTDLEDFDILLSASTRAPRPWVAVPPHAFDSAVSRLEAAVQSQPIAAAVLTQVLRMTLALSYDQALLLESLAYSMLLAGASFRAWRAATPVRCSSDGYEGPRVQIFDNDGVLDIRLSRADARNAVDAQMRDALVEALEFATIHPDCPRVVLTGDGPAFCSGGDMNEFGRASDPGKAHVIRTLRSVTRLIDRIRTRVTASVHGACVGAGTEMSAAAGRVVAKPSAFFRLPELSMGLIPGAGGTASISRRVGRHRACYMALSGYDIDVETALSWGLVDEVSTDT